MANHGRGGRKGLAHGKKRRVDAPAMVAMVALGRYKTMTQYTDEELAQACETGARISTTSSWNVKAFENGSQFWEESSAMLMKTSAMLCAAAERLRFLSTRPCPHVVTSKEGTSYCSLAEDNFKTGAIEALEKAEIAAKTFHHFGPSTRCPECGNSNHVLRCYTLGRTEAAEAVRALKDQYR